MNKCKFCRSKDIVLIEYDYTHPGHYDGWSEMECQNCKKRTGRWSGKQLKGKQYEDPKFRYQTKEKD